jgi:hypothetical protein
MEWIMANYVMVVTVLFALSEALALIPGVKANSVFQLVYNLFAGMLGKPKLPPAA